MPEENIPDREPSSDPSPLPSSETTASENGSEPPFLFDISEGRDVEVGSMLGAGNVAKVVSAEWLGVPVAIKILRQSREIAEQSTRLRSRKDFINEIQINRLLGSNPHVVQCFGSCKQTLYPESFDVGLVFEKVNGGTLDVTQLHSSEDRSRRISVALGIACALAHAHRLQIMHRDIKPGNILMTEHGLPKLGDWGLATLISEAKSKMTGTLEYMAPEIFRGDTSYDERADTFSFGIVLYMIATGRSHPYDFTYYTAAQIAQAVAENGLRPPIPRSMDTNIADLIEKCWSDSQEGRPPMAGSRLRLECIAKREFVLWDSISSGDGDFRLRKSELDLLVRLLTSEKPSPKHDIENPAFGVIARFDLLMLC
jgi:serine/threonine protein kinase